MWRGVGADGGLLWVWRFEGGVGRRVKGVASGWLGNERSVRTKFKISMAGGLGGKGSGSMVFLFKIAGGGGCGERDGEEHYMQT